jgi:predicted enzyme related to lactoylglutathione lyase
MEQDDDGAWTTPDGSRIAWFRDPDRNILSLQQPSG